MSTQAPHRKKSKYRDRGSKEKRHHTQPRKFKPTADKRLKKIFNSIGTPKETAFVADDFQQEALRLVEETDVLVSAPTGAGKTWIAVEAMRKVLEEGRRAWYASPLKALSNSKYHEFCEEYGEDNVGVITGDRKENTDASIVVGTTEILRNQLYDAMATGADFKSDLVILDEAHYLGDNDRGVVWEEVMIYLPARVRLLLLSATIPNDNEIADWLAAIRQHPCRVVHSEQRPVPIYPLYLLPGGDLLPLSGLDGVSKKIDSFINTSTKYRYKRHQITVDYDHILHVLGQFDLLPAVFFLKSRSDCNRALYACKKRTLSSERTRQIKHRLDELLYEYPFLENHPQLPFVIHHGIGAHHGGQLPHWKIVVEKLMQEGLLDAIFSTSTVAAGVNFPARTVVLAQSDRFNGKEFVSLTATELHQATGRAGRRGKDNIGFAVMVHGPYQDPHLIDKLFTMPPDPIDSQIKINFSMCLNLMLSQSPEEIRELLKQSFATYQNMESQHELERRSQEIESKLAPFRSDWLCENTGQVRKRIKLRQENNKRLHRLIKKRKKHSKVLSKTDLPPEADPTIQDLTRRINDVQKSLQNLPCDECPNFQICHQLKDKTLTALLYDDEWVEKALDHARNALWREFQHHLAFLKKTGFADPGGRLTPDGVWASKLRLDQPLIIAELIRKGMLTDLTPELLAGIIAVFVNDKFRDIDLDTTVDWDRGPLLDAYYDMKDDIEEMVVLKEKHNFSTPMIQFWPAAAMYIWASGKTWEEVIMLTSIDEGDLAMLIYRTADNLRQLVSLDETHPELAEKARTCVAGLLREPVILPT